MSMSKPIVDAIEKLRAKDPKSNLEGLNKVVTLCAQGENCSTAIPVVSKVLSKTNVNAIRKRNYIMSKYTSDDSQIASSVSSMIEMGFTNQNPLISALAVKQAGLSITDFNIDQMIQIIIKGASHQDPFVRKAAALSILKSFHASPNSIQKFNLVPVLYTLLRDNSPLVASNAAATITEINSLRTTPLISPEYSDVMKLLQMIPQLANEWAKINIFNFVSSYTPASEAEATQIIQALPPYLISSVYAVTMAAIRIIFNMSTYISESYLRESMKSSLKKITALLNNPQEIQYVAYTAIYTILQNFPTTFMADDSFLQNFMIKEEDPIYIELIKLDILLSLMTSSNALTIVTELAQYARSDEEKLSRKAIQNIGKIAVLSPTVSDQCVEIIENLLQSNIPYAIQECITISANIIRKYHDKYQKIIPAICQCMPSTFSDDRAKATLAWIIGEDSTKISNAAVVQRSHELIDTIFVHNYQNESPDVQLAIMAAVVKIFLTNPSMADTKSMLEQILSISINNSDNPDIRDRAFFYLNIINDLGERALDIIASQEDQSLSVVRPGLPASLAETLLPLVGTCASVYLKFPAEFVPPPIICDEEKNQQNTKSDEIDFGKNTSTQTVVYPILAESVQENFWTEISGNFENSEDGMTRWINLRISNQSSVKFEISRIVIKGNIFGLTVKDGQTFPTVESQSSQDLKVYLTQTTPPPNAECEDDINVAIVANRPSNIFFGIPLTLSAVLMPESMGRMTKAVFAEQIETLDPRPKPCITVPSSVLNSANDAREFLNGKNLCFLGKQGECTFFTAMAVSQDKIIVRITLQPNGSCMVETLCINGEIAKLIAKLIVSILS